MVLKIELDQEEESSGRKKRNAGIPLGAQRTVVEQRNECFARRAQDSLDDASIVSGVRPIADFIFGEEETLSGIFVYEKNEILSGLEVYGLSGDAPKSLPEPGLLRPFGN